MVTFTIEIIGDTETKYGTLTVASKTALKDTVQRFLAESVKLALNQQEAAEDVTDDVSVVVS